MLRIKDIQIRDPFILTLKEEGRYVLYGTTDKHCWSGKATGFNAYTSVDLKRWRGPHKAFRPPKNFWADRNFWAPEVHRHGGRFFMFASFKSADAARGTQVLVSDRPEGPFRRHSPFPVTPQGWECLDGTLHVDARGRPWMVFCHEWVQIGDGAICAMPLSDDLTTALAPPQVLFSASSAPWTVEARWNDGTTGKITDGPFLHRTAAGVLVMLWSSLCKTGYALAVARSDGGLLGPWHQQDRPLFGEDGGHGMLFRTFAGDLRLAIHRPNAPAGAERPVFLAVQETADGLELASRPDALA